MKKNLGFSSFEFYFVASAIGLILIVGIQRYYKLAQETQRLGFEILASNFSAAVYSYHARWFMAQQSSQSPSQLVIEKSIINFSTQGWPLAVNTGGVTQVSLATCLTLWNSFLDKAPAISYEGGVAYGERKYHLSLTTDGKCHFEWVEPASENYYFEYSPVSGQINIYTKAKAIAKNS